MFEFILGLFKILFGIFDVQNLFFLSHSFFCFFVFVFFFVFCMGSRDAFFLYRFLLWNVHNR